MNNLDTQKIKADFPIFNTNKDLVYLDTAATSQTPQVVIDAVTEYYTNYRANIHRGLYELSEKATDMYEKSREVVADFLGADKNEIIFTAGATASSNMLIHLLENELVLNEGDEIVVSIMEHHANLVPLQKLAERKKLVLKFIPLQDDNQLDMAEAQNLITSKTKIVSVLMASNVLGTINDIEKLTEYAHEVGAFMVCDATATVGHIDVSVNDVDALYFSGHKICGPTGIGVLYLNKQYVEKFAPAFYGGGIVEEVHKNNTVFISGAQKFESGTPNIAGVAGLSRAILYLKEIGLDAIHNHAMELVEYTIESLKQIDGVSIVAQLDKTKNIGTVSFILSDVHVHDIVEILSRYNIAVRAGHHCAQPLHEALDARATVRASLYLYNSKEDIDKLVEGLKQVKKIFA